MATECIVRGPRVPAVPGCSLAEYILPKLKSLPKNHVCLVDGETGDSRTVEQILSKSCGIVQGLKRLGLMQNDVIGLVCANSFEANEIMLASWIAAATIAPINCFSKVAELQHSFQLLKPKFVFCEQNALDNMAAALNQLKAFPTVIVINGSQNSRDAHLSLENLHVEVDVDDFQPPPVKSPSTQLAVIMPSSGTSGLPKGIGITHTNLIFQDILSGQINYFGGTGTYLQLSNFFWVTGILGFLRGMSTGLKRIIVRNQNHKNIFKAIQEYKPEWTFTSPLFLLSMIQSPEFHEYDLSSFKYAVIGGSPLTESVQKKIKEKWNKLTIIQVYGTTESSGIIAQNVEETLSVGKVVPGVSLKVIDLKTGEALKSHGVGEILVKSLGIMKGYYENEKETKESIDKDGWLRTGDVGYYDDAGNIFVIDRIKEMIKVKNFQVAPAEVENVILGIDGVLGAGVVGVTHEDDNKIMALVVKKKTSNINESDIYAHVEEILSDVKKLTGGVYFVDSLPINSNGKILRAQLKELARRFQRAG